MFKLSRQTSHVRWTETLSYIYKVFHIACVARGRVAGGWERHGNRCGTVESFS